MARDGWRLDIGWAWWALFGVTHLIKAIAAAIRGDAWAALIYGAAFVGFAWFAAHTYRSEAAA